MTVRQKCACQETADITYGLKSDKTSCFSSFTPTCLQMHCLWFYFSAWYLYFCAFVQGVLESFVGTALAGAVFCLFAGQPLTILSSTGPVLVFERLLFNFSKWVADTHTPTYWSMHTQVHTKTNHEWHDFGLDLLGKMSCVVKST